MNLTNKINDFNNVGKQLCSYFYVSSLRNERVF